MTRIQPGKGKPEAPNRPSQLSEEDVLEMHQCLSFFLFFFITLKPTVE